MTIERDGEAAAALALIRETKRAAAVRARAPAWYHAGMGAVIAMLVAAGELPRGELFSGVGLCLLAALAVYYQKRTGTWLNGYTAGGTRPRRILLLGTAAIVAIILLAVWLKFHRDLDGAMIVAGIVTGLFATWLGHAWERAFIEDAGA